MEQETTVLTDLRKMVKDRIEEVGGCDDLLPVLDYIKLLEPKEKNQIKNAFKSGKCHAHDDWNPQLYYAITYNVTLRKFI